jgi:hypothetical protein
MLRSGTCLEKPPAREAHNEVEVEREKAREVIDRKDQKIECHDYDNEY